jgi:ssDNA-binding Zn-finger/Zn-ribbon topoisomerase 1
MICPDCSKAEMIEIEVEREFQVGRKAPVTLKATAVVEQCPKCRTELHGWQMERAKSLALSAFLKENHKGADEAPEDLRIGHAASSWHLKQLEHTGQAGCFYCLRIFPVKEIEDWTDDKQTAICPKCGIDSVVPVTENVTPEFLKRMQQFWFDAAATV